MNEEIKLLPCPFCGDEPLEQRFEPHKHFLAQMPDYPGSWSVECVKCECRIFDHDSRENAVTKWNRRAPAHADEPVAKAIHYPDCWDTTAYPTLADALAEVYGTFKCTNEDAHPSAGIRSEVIGGEPMACPFCACEMMAGSPDYVTAKTEHGKECPLYTVHPMRCSWPSRQWNHRAERAELPTTLRIPAYPQRLDHDGIPDKNGAYILTDDYEKLRAYVRALGESS